MDGTQGNKAQRGELDEEKLRQLLKQQGIGSLDDLVRHVVRQARSTTGGLGDQPGGLEWTAVYDSDKWGFIIK